MFANQNRDLVQKLDSVKRKFIVACVVDEKSLWHFVVPCTCSGTAFHVFKIVRYCYFSSLEEGFKQNNRFGKKTTIFLFYLHK